jgi:predicted aspartyl protease
MRIYKAEKRGALLTTRAFLEGTSGKAYAKLLLDTGSAYTLISQEILESIFNICASLRRSGVNETL